MGRGLSDLQRWLLDQQGRARSPAELARDYYGLVTAAGRADICRALSRLRRRGLLPLAKNTPQWQLSANERCRLEQADCLEFLARLPAGSVDLVFGSPPYEKARLYLENGVDLGIARDTAAWVRWMVEVYQAALRCCRGLVAFVVGNGKTKNFRWSGATSRLETALLDHGICLREPPIFVRHGIPGAGGHRKQHADNGGSADWLRGLYEKITCATHGGKLPWGDTLAIGTACKYPPGGDPSHRRQDGNRAGHARRGRKNGDTVNDRKYRPPDVANPGNIFHARVGGGGMGDKEAHENEGPFPEQLAEDFVRCFCPAGGMVCDPFCGSGTTAKAALRWGRRFVGCDVRLSQVELTRRRLAAVRQEENP
jgi:hypothetical protein